MADEANKKLTQPAKKKGVTREQMGFRT